LKIFKRGLGFLRDYNPMLGFGTGEDPREDSDNKTTPGGRGLERNIKKY
jgi:hypothetical protein